MNAYVVSDVLDGVQACTWNTNVCMRIIRIRRSMTASSHSWASTFQKHMGCYLQFCFVFFHVIADGKPSTFYILINWTIKG